MISRSIVVLSGGFGRIAAALEVKAEVELAPDGWDWDWD